MRLLQALLVGLDHLLDHLAADGAGFTGGQVAVVAVLQVDANLAGSQNLELVHGFASLGHIDLVVALHTVSLLFRFFPGRSSLPGGNDFLSANISLPELPTVCQCFSGKTPKIWKETNRSRKHR